MKQRAFRLKIPLRGDPYPVPPAPPDPAPSAQPSRGPDERLLRRREVMERTGLPHSTLYAMMARGEFPRPVPIGPQAVAWPASAVQQWIAERVEPAEPAGSGETITITEADLDALVEARVHMRRRLDEAAPDWLAGESSSAARDRRT